MHLHGRKKKQVAGDSVAVITVCRRKSISGGCVCGGGFPLTWGERSLSHRAAFTPTGHSETPISRGLHVSVDKGDGGGAGGVWGRSRRRNLDVRGLN